MTCLETTFPAKACDVVFRNGARVIPHNDPDLHLAETVSIDFGEQKSEIKDETVSQDSNDWKELNPVWLFAQTIKRLRTYPGYSEKWELYTYFDGKTFTKIPSKEILLDLRSSVDCIGIDILGFTSKDIGTHSVRASLAMMMYLSKEPIYTIMLMGRWSSDAFLAYIEKQVKEFTKGVSTRMLQFDTFYNIPLAREERANKSQNQSRSSQRQANLNILGRQAGSLRHQLRPRN